jgi:hypothetical protein
MMSKSVSCDFGAQKVLFFVPENLCCTGTCILGAVWYFNGKYPCLPVMTGRENRDTLLTENDRFLGMKENFLLAWSDNKKNDDT